MRRLIAPTLVFLLTALFIIVFQSVRNVTIREAVLYQGFFPIDAQSRIFELGDIVVADLLTGRFEALLNGPCELSNSPRPEIEVRESSQSFKARSMVRFVASDGTHAENKPEMTFEVSTIDPISYLNAEFFAHTDCEGDLRSSAQSYCLLVVKSVAMFEGIAVGFDVSERCQIINASLEPVVLDQLSTASSFDGIFGIPLMERLWVNATRELVGFSVTVSSS